MLRRLTTKRRKTKKDKESTDIQAEGDGEEIQIPEGEETNERPDKNVRRSLHYRRYYVC